MLSCNWLKGYLDAFNWIKGQQILSIKNNRSNAFNIGQKHLKLRHLNLNGIYLFLPS